jgi:hypothetical protein
MSAKVEPLRPDLASVVGYIDEVLEDRIYGWAWDRRRPEHRVEIQIWMGDRPIATTMADRARSDLRLNGVGDGMHAFEVALPEAAPGNAAKPIRVLARSITGDLIELRRRPPPEDVDAKAPLEASLRRIFDELETLRAMQNRLGRATQATLGDLRRLSGTVDAAPRASAANAEELRALQSQQTAMLERLGTIEAFALRVDATMADLAGRVDALAERPRERRVPIWVLAAAVILSIAVCAVGFGAYLGYLR